MKFNFRIEGKIIKSVEMPTIPQKQDIIDMLGKRYRVSEIIFDVDTEKINIDTYREVTHI